MASIKIRTEVKMAIWTGLRVRAQKKVWEIETKELLFLIEALKGLPASLLLMGLKIEKFFQALQLWSHFNS